MKPTSDLTVTCSSVDYVAYSLMVEVDGSDRSAYFALFVNTTTPGKYYFPKNAFNKNQLISLTCIVTT